MVFSFCLGSADEEMEIYDNDEDDSDDSDGGIEVDNDEEIEEPVSKDDGSSTGT